MAKSIKKSLKYFAIAVGIIVMFPTLVALFLQVPLVQTLVVRRITGHLSETISSTISVGKVEYKFFNRLQLNDILIKDKNHDTLAYISRLTAGIRAINLDTKSFAIGKLEIEKPVIELVTDSTGQLNLTWYLDMLSSDQKNDSVVKPSPLIKANSIEISEGRFSMTDKRAVKSKSAIDFSNLRLSDINVEIDNISSGADSTSFAITGMNFREASGFNLRRLSTSGLITHDGYRLRSLFLSTDSSIVNIEHISLRTDSTGSYRNFLDDVRIDLLLQKSRVSFTDLGYFVPALREMKSSFEVSGKILGTISELRGRNIGLSYGNNTALNCDFDISGLPKIDNSYIYLGVNTFTTSATDIMSIKIPGVAPLVLPESVIKLGKMEFDGSFTGFTTDFVTYGNFRTSAGTIRTDISLRPEESKLFRVKGLVSLNNIALGYLTASTDLIGNVTMKADIDVTTSSIKKFSGSLNGKIDSIELNSYKYRNVALRGNFTEKAWDGSVSVSEKNIKLDILGLFNFTNKLPEFDFTLNLARANLYKLNFDKADTSSRLSMLLTANFRGSNIDNLDGEIRLLNSTLRKYETNLDLYDFSLRTFVENSKPAINIRTDFVDADLRGYYNFAGLGSAVKTTMAMLMPSKYKIPQKKDFPVKNNFTFNINFKKTDKLFNFFRSGLLLADKSTINGTIIPDSIIYVKANTRMLNVKNIVARDLSFEAKILNPILTAKLKTSSLNILNQTELEGFRIDFSVHPDTMNLAINWDDRDNIRNNGSISAHGIVSKSSPKDPNGILNITIDSTDIYSNGNLWKVAYSNILIDTTTVKINNLSISNKANFYHINGTVSSDPADTISFEVRGIDIAPLNAVTDSKSSTDQMSLSLRGNLNGKILLTNIYKQPLVMSSLKIRNFSILQSDYGDVDVSSAWDNERKVVDILARNNLDGKKMLDIKGYYDPGQKYLFLDGELNKLPVDALNPLLKSFASGISGTATGKVNFSGPPGRFVLKGALMAENTVMKVDFLQVKYKMNDSIRFERNKIVFRNVKVTDEKGNAATINGSINHRYFGDYQADMMIKTNNCMVLNTKPKDNNLFYGTAYASGATTIKSGPGTISFDISAKTGKNTKFNIPMYTSTTVSDYSFVDFIRHDTVRKDDEELKPKAPVSTTLMDVNFDLEVTPDAEIQIIFDPKVGDIMKGTGSGNLSISLDKQGNFRIFGDYIIDDGEYLFTLKNILNKSFSVENGGKITFDGDINDAAIDIKAIYKTKASLYEITGDEKYKEQIPVQCQINLSGKLFNPVVGLDIYLPTADESTRAYLRNMITTEEELSRQFLYLLVTGHFYSDMFAGSSVYSSTTATGTSAMAVTTAEMVSTQLSNMLSKISNDFNVGFVYRPGYKDLNSNEVSVALSTQLLNDRVMINGNFDVTGSNNSSSTNNQLIGDFDIETKITDKIKFKVFNRYNDPYTGKQAPYTQGIGIFYKEDFDKLADIFRKKIKPDANKKDSPKPADKKNPPANK